MKTKFLIIVSLLMVQMAIAQKMNPQEMAEYQNKIMFEKLDLNESQKEKLTAHNIEFSEKQATLMNREGSMFSKIGEVKKLKKLRNAELEKILSKSQMEVFEDDIEPEIRSYMRSKMKG